MVRCADFARFAAAALLALALAVSPVTLDDAKGEMPDGDVDALNRISAYLNQIKTLEGRFIQVESTSGVQDKGTFYMRRPGKLRFEYDKPNPITIISDGTWVAVMDDFRPNNTMRFPLSATPLKFLLRKKVDLADEAKIVAVQREPGSLLVTAREDDGPAQGEITMIFSDPALELQQWITTDATGKRITVALSDVRRDTKISPRLFEIEDKDEPFGRRR